MRMPGRLLMVFAVLAIGGFARADVEDDKDQLADLEKRCAKALVSGNVQWLSSFYAQDWFLIGAGGRRFTREQTLDELSSGRMKWNSCVFTDLEVHVFGDAAVVIYKATAIGILNGGRIQEVEICSDTFARGDEGWRCIHSHNSLAP